MDERDADGLLTVAVVWTRSELAALLGLLRFNDVAATPIGELHVSADPYLAVALGGVRVRVHPEDAPLACALLAEVDPEPYGGPLFSRKRLVNIVATLLLILAFAPAPARIPALFLPANRLAPRSAAAVR